MRNHEILPVSPIEVGTTTRLSKDLLPSTKVVILSGYQLLLEGLRRILAETPWIDLVAEVRDPMTLIEVSKRDQPDVVLLEVSELARDILDLLSELRRWHTKTRLLVLAPNRSNPLVLRMLRTGAHGFLSHRATAQEVVGAIRTVSSGRIYLTPELERMCAERYLGTSDQRSPEERLSNRELQVLCFLARGSNHHEIARTLYISVKTVDTHRCNLLRKLELRNNSDLTRFALEHGLIS